MKFPVYEIFQSSVLQRFFVLYYILVRAAVSYMCSLTDQLFRSNCIWNTHYAYLLDIYHSFEYCPGVLNLHKYSIVFLVINASIPITLYILQYKKKKLMTLLKQLQQTTPRPKPKALRLWWMSTHLLIQIKIRAEAVIAGLQRFTSDLQAATQASLLRVAQDGFYIYISIQM